MNPGDKAMARQNKKVKDFISKPLNAGVLQTVIDEYFK